MTTCANCSRTFEEPSATCPYCRSSTSGSSSSDGLARIDARGGYDDRLDRSISESLLGRTDVDVESFLARDTGGPLALSELRDAIARVDTGDPSVADLEGSLEREATIALDGIALSELVDKKGSDMKIIKRGLVFLKNRRWAEALEWWTLQREALDPSRDRLELLLLLMEAFTHRLAGDLRRAGEVRARINAHPVFKRMRGLART